MVRLPSVRSSSAQCSHIKSGVAQVRFVTGEFDIDPDEEVGWA